MLRFFSIICMLLFLSCSKTVEVSEGELFEVIEPITQEGSAKNVHAYTDEFNVTIPEGTILQATRSSITGRRFFEAVPIAIDGETDPSQLEQMLVPHNVRKDDGYMSYSFGIKLNDIGVKLKRIEDE